MPARVTAGQTELDLVIFGGLEAGMFPITSSQMTHLWEGLCTAYGLRGSEAVTKGDSVFRDLVLARIIGPPAGSTPPGCSAKSASKRPPVSP